jgi:ankyrin repeat protein
MSQETGRLYQACTNGDLRAVRLACASCVDLNQMLVSEWVKEKPNTALGIATKERHIHVMQFLLQVGVDVDRLMSIAESDESEDSDDDSTDRVTPLSCAIKDDDSKDLVTPLCCAIKQGNPEAVRLLLEYGANAQLKDTNGYGYLHCMTDCEAWHGGSDCSNKNLQIVELLLQHGVNVDQSNCAAKNSLFRAAHADLHEIIPVLLQHGFSVNMTDKNNNTALHIACDNSCWQTAKVLVDMSADIFLENNNCLTSFDVACRAGSYNYNCRVSDTDMCLLLELLQMFLDHGAAVNQQRKLGWTALHAAVNGVNLSMARLLLENGASPHIKTNLGATPLVYCFPLEKKTMNVVDLLLEYGACMFPPLDTFVVQDKLWKESSVAFQMDFLLNWYYSHILFHAHENELFTFVVANLNEALTQVISSKPSATQEEKNIIGATVISIVYDFVYKQISAGWVQIIFHY